MKYSKILRILALATVLALLSAIVPANPAFALGELRIRPSSGKIGEQIEVWGTNFDATLISLYFSRDSAAVGGAIDTDVTNYELIGNTTAMAGGVSGSFVDFYFFVPDELEDGAEVKKVYGGTHYIYVTVKTQKEILAKIPFTVETVAAITLDTAEGIVGSEVKVSGTGFALSTRVSVKFDGTEVTAAISDSMGSITNVAFNVPESHQGSHTIEVKDANDNSDTSTFTTTQSISLSPTSGLAGDTITVSGTGFSASKGVTISFGDTVVQTAEMDSIGSFSATITALPGDTGSYEITAIDADDHSAIATFNIGVASISVGASTGKVGDTVAVSGIGFQSKTSLPILFDNKNAGTVTTDQYGKFDGSFTVPARGAGTYKITVSDGTNTIQANFSIAASASISPKTSADSPGHVGSKLTISGVGFIPEKTVTINYDGKEITTSTVKSDGTFSAELTAPASKGGQHTVIATDGTNSKEFSFFMESKPPSTPATLKPEMDIEAEKETYFDWEDASDHSGVTYTLQIANSDNFTADSIVLEKAGLASSEYTITEEEKLESVSEEEPYYWRVRAIDEASNLGEWSEMGSFYTGGSFGFNLSQTVINVLIGIGALLFGIFCFWLGRKTAYY